MCVHEEQKKTAIHVEYMIFKFWKRCLAERKRKREEIEKEREFIEIKVSLSVNQSSGYHILA